MRRTGYRPHDRARAPRGKVLWLLAAMLATLFLARCILCKQMKYPRRAHTPFLVPRQTILAR